MSSLGKDKRAKRYWRSLDELAETPQFRAMLEQEFPGGAWQHLDATSRRSFLKVMGASLAFAGMTGCRWPKEAIVPYAHRPDGVTPGNPRQFATAREVAGVATGLLVTSYDGRPTKIEGNPSHPFSLGATDALAQASVLGVYDPDRSRTVVHRVVGQTIKQKWDQFSEFARSYFGELRSRRGKGLAVLSEATSSPSVAALRARLAKVMPEAAWYEYEPISYDNEREGIRAVFGAPYRPHPRLDLADVIISLDADLLMTHPAAVRYARDFAARRRAADGTMNRLYAVESVYSITGSMADHRLAIRSADVSDVAGRLYAAVSTHLKGGPATARSDPDGHGDAGREAIFVRAMANDLLRNRGRSVVMAGPRQPAEVHAIAHTLNSVLGNVGKTIRYTADTDPERPPHMRAIEAIVKAIDRGGVEAMLILGGNPVYDAPADVAFAGHLRKVKTSIHLSLYDDETSNECTWHVPRAHYLELWGDARAYDGTVSIVQPLIAPLYGGKTPGEILGIVLDEQETTGYEIARRTFAETTKSSDLERAWRKALHDGIVPGTAFPDARVELRSPRTPLASSTSPTGRGQDRVEVVFCQDHCVYDGRFGNNAWLQEMPDPMTKVTWDNVAAMSPATAESLQVANGNQVRLSMGDRRLVMPVYVLPGLADGSVAVSLGYGRYRCGRVGNGVGQDTYMLRTRDAKGFAPDARVEKVPADSRIGAYALATTQGHHPITRVGQQEESRRAPTLVLEADLAEFQARPDFAKHAQHHPPLKSLWTEHTYGPHRWGMAIDLAACTGCNACVTACQAENNVPVVGKEQVFRGREMHWLRVDRYFVGDPAAPRAVHQPMMCAHCENAPCEQVCPVGATVHDSEGLNVMVYNRCVGTRYCSNNCPFKVRRFNFFNYHLGLTETEKMVMNPDVTVRSRGVMEKCTYCLQRIHIAKIRARNDRRPILDGEIVPACAQACPTRAIVFGDLSDDDSEVSRLQAQGRAYHMLAELNIKTRTAYLARLRNPSPDLAGAPKGQEHG